MATKAQIRNKVLRKLKVLHANQSAPPDDATIVEDIYDEVYAYLSERNAVTWGSSDDIPAEAVQFVVRIVAYESADEYLSLMDESRYQRLKFEAYGSDDMSGAFGELVRLSAVDYVPLESEADYY